jgi:PAS domain S-box-containing protein
MDQVIEFFQKLFDSSDWPPRWHCGRWTEFHGWLYIISDLLIWSAYFTIPVVIIRYISKKHGIRFIRLYFLFAAFILACGATHFLDALAFWIPAYRLNALFRFITAATSWVTVFYLVKYLPVIFSLRPQKELEAEIQLRKRSEEKFRGLLEAAPDAMVIANEKGEISLINRQTEKMFGFMKEELIGRPVETLIPANLPNKHAGDRIRYFANPKARAMGVGLELNAIKKDGTQFPVEISLSPLMTEAKTEMDYFHKSGSSFFGAATANGIKNEQGETTALIFIIRDITKHKLLEDDLKKLNEGLEEKVLERTEEIYKNEKRFRALVENNYDIISLLDESFKIIYRGPSATRILGWSNDEMMDSDIFKNIHPDDRKATEHIIRESMANPRKPMNVLFRRLHKDGHYVSLEGTVTNMQHDENVKAIVFNFRDVTERIEENKKLLASEARYRRLFEAAKDGILILNSDTGIIEDVNPFLMIMLGYSHAEFLGKHLWEIGLFKDIIENKSAFQDLKKKGYSRYDNLPLQTKDHRIAWVEFVSNIYDVNGTMVVQCNIRDIADRKKAAEEIKKSNERFEMVVSATNDVIWDWDIGTNKFWWNENYYSHFGYDKKNTVLDVSSWQDGMHPDDKKRVLSGIHASLENHQSFWTDEYRFLKADRTVVFVLDCGYILYTEKGEPSRMVGAMLDITERKKAEEQLKTSLDEKQSSAERMSTILNALPANIAMLDEKGFIIDVNDSWKKFADDNGYAGRNVGDDYIKNVEEAFNDDENDCKAAALGIRNVLEKKTREFVREYACYPYRKKRWFRIVVTPLQEKEYAGAVVMHIDISELRKLEQERLENKIQEQKKLAKAILKAQEKERSAIGTELHDNVNQILAATNISLSIAKKHPEKSLEHIESSMNNIQHAIEENRRIAHELVAPDFEEIQLGELLNNLTDDMLRKAGINIQINIGDMHEDLLEEEQKLAIYRIAQEQCTNIIRYAEAKSVNISLTAKDGFFKMIIADDGKGMDTGKKTDGIGLRNIKGRLSVFNGEANIITSEEKGFALEISIPI